MRASHSTPESTIRRVRWIALGAAELMSAVGEFHLATQIGIHPSLAWLLPVGLAVYGYCAFASGSRSDVRAALGLMVVCQAMAHLLAIGLIPRHWTLVVVASAVAPIICWRVHHLGQHHADEPATAPAEPTPAPSVEPVPVEIAPPAQDNPARRPVKAPRTSSRKPSGGAVRATGSRRSPDEWRTLIERVREEHPDLNRKQLAAKVGISDRWLRTCLNTA